MERAHDLMWWLRLGFLPIRDMLRFRGRSRRSEVIAFFVLGTLANLMTLDASGDGTATPLLHGFKLGWMVLWRFPWFALFIRRLHDQRRTSLWALMAPAATALTFPIFMSLPQSENSGITVSAVFWTAHPAVTPVAISLSVLLAIVWIASFVLLLRGPEELGPNRYGPDPRVDASEAEIVQQ